MARKKRKALTLDEAKHFLVSNPGIAKVYADWFGPGWSMIFDGKYFCSLNPWTGSTLLHHWGERDQCDWFEGTQPRKDFD